MLTAILFSSSLFSLHFSFTKWPKIPLVRKIPLIITGITDRQTFDCRNTPIRQRLLFSRSPARQTVLNVLTQTVSSVESHVFHVRGHSHKVYLLQKIVYPINRAVIYIIFRWDCNIFEGKWTLRFTLCALRLFASLREIKIRQRKVHLRCRNNTTNKNHCMGNIGVVWSQK